MYFKRLLKDTRKKAPPFLCGYKQGFSTQNVLIELEVRDEVSTKKVMMELF